MTEGSPPGAAFRTSRSFSMAAHQPAWAGLLPSSGTTIYGYARVSTRSQDVARQVAQLREAGVQVIRMPATSRVNLAGSSPAGPGVGSPSQNRVDNRVVRNANSRGVQERNGPLSRGPPCGLLVLGCSQGSTLLLTSPLCEG
jgi:hypothetical protein